MATYGEQLTVGQIPHLHAQSHLLGHKTAIIEGRHAPHLGGRERAYGAAGQRAGEAGCR